MDKNVTKQGLLKLKKSKPIPITAHTGEIIVPCVYTEVVGDFMKKKGIKLPLDVHKLAELRRIAQATGKNEGYAKGTKNLKKSRKVKLPKKNTVQIKGSNIVGGPISSNDMISIKIGQPKPRARQARPVKKEEVRIPPPLLPESNERGFSMLSPPNFHLIRPFSTSAPNGNQAVPIQPHPDSLLYEKQQEERNRKMLEHERKVNESFAHFSKLTKDSHDILRRDITHVAGFLMENYEPYNYQNATASSSSSSFTTPNPFVDQKSRIEELIEYKGAEGKEEEKRPPKEEDYFTLSDEEEKEVIQPTPPKNPPPTVPRPKKPILPKPDVKEEVKDDFSLPETWRRLFTNKEITRERLNSYPVKARAGAFSLRVVARQMLGLTVPDKINGRDPTKESLVQFILDAQG